MRHLLWLIVILLVFIVQGSLSVFGITPNLAVVLVCYVGLRKGEITGMSFGAFLGIIGDSLAGPILGPNLLSKGLIGYFSSLMYRRLFVWTPVFGVISIVVLTAADGILVLTARGIFDKMPVDFGAAAFIILVQSLLNAPFGIFLKPKPEE